MTKPATRQQEFDEAQPDFGSNEDCDIVRGNAKALHAAVRTKNMQVVERYVAPWHVHIDRHGQPHDFDAWASSLQRQPERWRDVVLAIGEITIHDGMALLSGYVRLDGRGPMGEVLAGEVVVRFTQVWVNLDGDWRRVSSRTSTAIP